MVKIYDPAYSRIMRIVLNERYFNNIVWNNATCVAQIIGGHIKGDRIKHISPKFFYIHELHKKGNIYIQQIRSSDNLTDLFTKVLPTSTFKKLVRKLECAASEMLHAKSRVYLIRGSIFFRGRLCLCIVLFFS